MNENEFYISDKAEATHDAPPSPHKDCARMESLHDLFHRTGVVHHRH